jgi:hypothetical protein
MKIVDRAAFLDLPEGTVYAKGEPWAFGSLSIKGESVANRDWWYLDPCWVEAEDSNQAFDRLDEMRTTGASYPMESAVSRDGLFDQDAIFMVFERDDLLKLKDMVDTAIAAASPAIME